MFGDLLVFTISEHYLVPEHVLIREEKVDELMAELGIKKESLPKISKGDAAIKHLKPKSGDVVKIIRDSLTAGQSVYYRRVVK
jgi:DNA-directed RNA polymerase subunit H